MLFTACENYSDEEMGESKQENYSLDYLNYYKLEYFEEINIDSIKTFSILSERLKKNRCNNKISGLKFTYKKSKYFLIGSAECPSQGIGCYMNVNSISIKNDSIIIDYKNKEHISSLGSYLKNITDNPYNYKFKKVDLKPAIIRFEVDDKYSIEKTKEVLKEIILEFKKYNTSDNPDHFKYFILFDGLIPVPPPPPPPPMAN
ncbi:hypothetical protein [uncultured Christiangramia sp.]|uniref:hypothetical protein n=1 Tax=uncultured Christiangramia sp. TaxID=503836 RepID=UPI0026320743|nr:hypothetical protein [uncultured Christiangramia sp.]